MSEVSQPVCLTPSQVAGLNARLAELRHGINNRLTKIVAAAEILQRKPDMIAVFAPQMIDEPQRISDDVAAFSAAFEEALGLRGNESRG